MKYIKYSSSAHCVFNIGYYLIYLTGYRPAIHREPKATMICNAFICGLKHRNIPAYFHEWGDFSESKANKRWESAKQTLGADKMIELL